MSGVLIDSEVRFPDPVLHSLYRYAATYQVGGHVVRVRFVSAGTRRESLAVVEVLSAGLTWTVLIDSEPPERIPGEFDHARVEGLADHLVRRAGAILRAAGGAAR